MSTLQYRPTTSHIDLNNLAFNFKSVRRFLGRNIKHLAVVKANAYGHGATECARRLEKEGVDWFGVALLEEGVELRNSGITKPILILGGLWPGQEHLVIKHRLVPVIFDVEQAALLDAECSKAGFTIDYHVKIDTGMGRLGVRYDQAGEMAAALKAFTKIRLDGLMTHFAAADDLDQLHFSEQQMSRFDRVSKEFLNAGFAPTYFDLANSPGAIAIPAARRSMVRLGGILYGLAGDVLPKGIAVPELRPVLSLTSKIAQIRRVPAGESLGYGRTFFTKRESLIATVPIGYADGFPRSLSNVGQVIVNNTFAPIVGRISMDWTIVDVTDVAGAAVGCDVTLIGRSESLAIDAAEIAADAGTISYEITCGIGPRVRRSFIG